MKSLLIKTSALTALAILFLFGCAVPGIAQDGRVQLTQLDHLTAKASDAVDVSIDGKLMQLTAKFLGNDPDDAKVKALINGLKGIYVKSFEFELEGQYTSADLESIRTQLRGSAWTRIVNISSKKEGGLEVYLMSGTAGVGGLTVLVSEPKELTVVNIVGPVDLDKLSQLEGKFGIPDLELEAPKTKPRN